MFKSPFFSVLLLTSLAFFRPSDGRAQFVLDSTVVDTTTLLNGLETPWEIKWGPDQFIWMTERKGYVSRVNSYTGAQHEVLDISNIISFGPESGLMGMAFHPDFADTPWVYLAYNQQQSTGKKVVISRFEYDGNLLVNPVMIVDTIKGALYHNGCRLTVSSDRKIFASTGDALMIQYPYDSNSLNGKILRFNLDGSVPADNPIPGNPIWTFGHRNPQGLAFGPNGILYSSEHGPNSDDEFQIIRKGKNYGWPNVWGFCDTANALESPYCEDTTFVEPLIAWTPTIAPSDLLWYDHPAIPEWRSTFLMAVLKDKMVTSLRLDASGQQVLAYEYFFKNKFGRIRDICSAPDGRVFLATNGQTYGTSPAATNRILILENPDFIPQVSCDIPQNVASQRIGTNSIRLKWDTVTASMAYVIEGKPVSSSKTTMIYITDGSLSSLDVTDLNAAQTYAWRIRAICEDGPTARSAIDFFNIGDSLFCDRPDSIWYSNLTASSVQLNWLSGNGAIRYQISGRPIGFSGVVNLITNSFQNQYTINTLSAATGYEWSVRSICDSMVTKVSKYAKIDTFFTISPNKSARNVVNTSLGLACLVHPSPAFNEVCFKLQGVDFLSYNLYITNVQGLPVQTLANQKDKSLTINIKDLAPGLYFYQILFRDNRVLTGKFIKI